MSTVRNADHIIVLESGQIVEEGSPEELLAKKDGKFYRMYNDQKLYSLAVNELTANSRERSKVPLAAHFSMMPSDFIVSSCQFFSGPAGSYRAHLVEGICQKWKSIASQLLDQSHYI